jgi:hypothetical protein
VIASGTIGEVVSVQHVEPVQHLHMSHSYVRGPWRRKDEATPIILLAELRNQDLLPTTLEHPMESHIIGFMAEERRLAGGSPSPVEPVL